MPASPSHLRWPLTILALQACWAATAVRSDQGVEVDLVFPRVDETYEPGPLMPVVFAVQNPALAPVLHLTISWVIEAAGQHGGIDPDVDLTFGFVNLTRDLGRANLGADSPAFFAADGAPGLNDTDRGWILRWQVASSNCTDKAARYPIKSFTKLGGRDWVRFSTKKGGGVQPDLAQAVAAAAADGTCANRSVVAIAATDQGELADKRRCITVHGPPDVKVGADPCKPSLDATAAASVSAAMTAQYCETATASPVVSCRSGGTRLWEDRRVEWLVPVVIGSLLYLVV